MIVTVSAQRMIYSAVLIFSGAAKSILRRDNCPFGINAGTNMTSPLLSLILREIIPPSGIGILLSLQIYIHLALVPLIESEYANCPTNADWGLIHEMPIAWKAAERKSLD
jgi:hypothetical protein